MAYYLFNVLPRDAPSGRSAREHATGLLRVGMWGIDAGERHPDALVHGDLVLVYLDAPEREFIGRAELASPVREWTPSEAEVYPVTPRAACC